MPVYIQHIETAVPETFYPQKVAAERMIRWTKDKRAKRYIEKIYRNSGIDVRYSVLADLDSDEPRTFFTLGDEGYPVEPSTSLRNRIFLNESKKMFVSLAEKLLIACPGVCKEDITHVITVSCTGFYNPGPDIQIIQELELSHSTQRYNIGFMGCCAAFPAIHMAKQFCQADPNAVVLVVSLEFCTLHLQLNNDLDTIVANSVFADGAAGLVVSSRQPSAEKGALRIDAFKSSLLTEGAEDMAWTIGDRGFDITLSKYVPKIIGAKIDLVINQILKGWDSDISEIDYWAVHPGGKAIIDQVQQGLRLEKEGIQSSRDVLKNFGNMSSATVLFVLQDIVKKASRGSKIYAMAFGPGLSIESALLSYDNC